jgi:hypothetical protein
MISIISVDASFFFSPLQYLFVEAFTTLIFYLKTHFPVQSEEGTGVIKIIFLNNQYCIRIFFDLT